MIAVLRAVSQLLWPDKDREGWFSLEENHEKGLRFGLHQLRNCSNGRGHGDGALQEAWHSANHGDV
jgi:hypothetical protein